MYGHAWEYRCVNMMCSEYIDHQLKLTDFLIRLSYLDVLFVLFCFVFVTPEGFTTVVANKGLEKARAYLNQVPRYQRLYIPSEGCGVNFGWKHLQTTPTHFIGQS